MTKKDIVRRIAHELGHTERETKAIVQRTLDAIINVVAAEGRGRGLESAAVLGRAIARAI